MKRIVFGVSGASGMPLASAILGYLASMPELQTHLIISAAARQVINAEGGEFPENAGAAVYDCADMSAPPASGSWRHDGMIICPCSMSTLAAIATGCGTNLIHRAADAALKERLPLALVVRETPLSSIHLRNMLAAASAGAIIMPFIPAFYAGDCTMPGAMRQFAGRLLDQLRIENNLCQRWGENAAGQ